MNSKNSCHIHVTQNKSKYCWLLPDTILNTMCECQGPPHDNEAEGAHLGVQGRNPWWGLGGKDPGKFLGL